MINLVCLAEIYKKVREHFPRISKQISPEKLENRLDLFFKSNDSFREENAEERLFPVHIIENDVSCVNKCQ